MSENMKKDLSVETSERFGAFCESLKKLISETQKGMTDVGRMSDQVELDSNTNFEIERVGEQVNNLEESMKRLSDSFSYIKGTVDEVNSLSRRVAAVVKNENSKILKNAEDVIAIASKITGEK